MKRQVLLHQHVMSVHLLLTHDLVDMGGGGLVEVNYYLLLVIDTSPQNYEESVYEHHLDLLSLFTNCGFQILQEVGVG